MSEITLNNKGLTVSPAQKAQFIERNATVPPDCHAVADGDSWAIYPKKLCRNATIIKCSRCGKPATHIDSYFPYHVEHNLCDRCRLERKNRKRGKK